MGKITRRGSLALTAAVAVVLSSAATASAAPTPADGADPLVRSDVTTRTDDTVQRVAGQDRIQTAIAASVAQYPSATGLDLVGTAVDTVVIARYDMFPDALAAAPLADAYDAPVLLTQNTGDLDPRVKAELSRLRVKNVIIIGGTGAVSATAEATIKGLGIAVERLEGSDRYATAVEIADYLVTGAYDSDPAADTYAVDKANTRVFLTTGYDPANPADGFADALAAGAAAAESNGVVLLTKGSEFDGSATKNEWGTVTKSSNTLGYLFENKTEGTPAKDVTDYVAGDLHLVGGPAANAVGSGKAKGTLSTDTEKALKSFVGKDRYETAVKVAGGTLAGGTTPIYALGATPQFAVASGETFADAVIASAFIANQDGPLLLTKAAELPKVTADFISANTDPNDAVANTGFEDFFLFGGTQPISAATEAAIKTAASETKDTTAPGLTASLKAGHLVGTSEPGATLALSITGGTVTGTQPSGAALVVPANGQFVLNLTGLTYEADKEYTFSLTASDDASPANVSAAFKVTSKTSTVSSLTGPAKGNGLVAVASNGTVTGEVTGGTNAGTKLAFTESSADVWTGTLPAGKQFATTDVLTVKAANAEGLVTTLVWPALV
ncbi:cell wall-binding repeat-containing protein [Georgenia yuyongxinii]|nr:cell wall-binding repeat-containing protein [Georgenia yuyongxinii]